MRDARVRAVDCGVGKGAPSMFVWVWEGSEAPWEQHQEKGSVVTGVAILLNAARWSGMNVSATRRVTTIRGSAPCVPALWVSLAKWRLAHATCN